MNMFKIVEFVAIVMISLTTITISTNLKISRVRPNTTDGWKEGTDSFKIFPSLSDHSTVNCTQLCATFKAEMSAQNGVGNCSCSCPNNRATLMFKDEKWKCRKKADVRRILGIRREEKTNLHGEGKELSILNINDYKKLDLPSRVHDKPCYIDPGSSHYIRCNGSKEILQSNQFKLHNKREIISQNVYSYYVEVKNATSNTNLLKGRIIKLWIKCPYRAVSRVLLFKYEGNVVCTISTSVLQPFVTTNPVNTTVTLLPSQTTANTRHPKTNTIPTQMASESVSSPTLFVTALTGSESPLTASPQTSSDVSDVSGTPTVISEKPTTAFAGVLSTYYKDPTTVSEAPITTLTLLPTSDTTTDYASKVRTRPSSSRERSTGEKSFSAVLIASLTASVLVIVIIVVVFVYRRRYLKKNPGLSIKIVKRKENVAMSPRTGSTDVQENEDDYKGLEFTQPAVYASGYQVPPNVRETTLTNARENNDNYNEGHVYTPLNISVMGDNVYDHRNNQKTAANDVKPQRNGPLSVDQCVYGLMEEIIMGALNGHVKGSENVTQPVYSVLEGPYVDFSKGLPRVVLCVQRVQFTTLWRSLSRVLRMEKGLAIIVPRLQKGQLTTLWNNPIQVTQITLVTWKLRMSQFTMFLKRILTEKFQTK